MKLRMILIGVLVMLSLHAQDVKDSLTVKGNLTVDGTITVNDENSPYTLPAADGTENQVLKTDGKGTVSWDAPAATTRVRFLICVNGMYPVQDVELDEHFIGEIIMFIGQGHNIPGNFLECRGQTLQVTEYMALYSIIGTTYGGNGTTNFNLPNLSGCIPQGQ